MFKKQRKIAPYFQTHPPFNAVTGQYASLTGELGVSPYCVLMQVAAEDTYADYVICRGFDTRMLVFVDYEAGNSDKPGISVAKPYGNRRTGAYSIGEVHPALLPIQGNATYTPPSPVDVGLRLGQNPGVALAAPEGGQPASLGESLTLLYDHNGIAVNWLLIGRGSTECEGLPVPGPYRAICGASIAPGETGPVVYDGTVYQAVNQSQCKVVIGDRVGFHVSPTCEAFFVPCVCDCERLCCERSVAICVCGQLFIVAVDGGEIVVNLDMCHDCEGATLTITMSCTGSTVSADWVYECGTDTDSGTITGLGVLCDDSEVITVNAFIDSAFFPTLATFSNTYGECSTPTTTPACWCPNESVLCSMFGVLFEVSGLTVNAPFDCGCADINGTYFASYPDDAVTNTCNQITLERQIVFDCPSGGITTLVLRWDMQCSANNLNLRMTAVLSTGGVNLPAIADTGIIAETLATFDCNGYSLTDAGPAVVGITDRCDATGASVTGTII